jgi:hypothetical protein
MNSISIGILVEKIDQENAMILSVKRLTGSLV